VGLYRRARFYRFFFPIRVFFLSFYRRYYYFRFVGTHRCVATVLVVVGKFVRSLNELGAADMIGNRGVYFPRPIRFRITRLPPRNMYIAPEPPPESDRVNERPGNRSKFRNYHGGGGSSFLSRPSRGRVNADAIFTAVGCSSLSLIVARGSRRV